ncbi:MAG: DUF2971 domain-containing protein [Lachnospiraceae bacterium]|nr:DUF2971 domain-containing protein [Lachnospiraceae bacterium]
MNFDVWKPPYVEKFDFDQYLYHYTNIDKALKIINTNSLRFSSINNMNDTSESKMKIIFSSDNITNIKEYKEITDRISNYFKECSDIIQLLCFSMDVRLNEDENEKILNMRDDKAKYYDVSGRGFALPRMWAQYATNNEGVCFIFNKRKLIKSVEDTIAFIKHGPVEYKKIFDRYYIDENTMDTLNRKILMISNGTLTLLNMIQGDNNFMKYNYFEKLDDWKSENEYRIIALIDNRNLTEPTKINNMSNFLEGIVIGEKMDVAYEKTIKLLIKNEKMNCEVKRIKFDTRLCKLI